MHVYFSGIGGAGIGPLALIAKEAGYDVSGSDKQQSGYTENLRSKGIDSIHIGQSREQIEAVHSSKPIDWLVYSSALPKEHPQHPELVYASEVGIRATKRDEFLQYLLTSTGQKLIAIAGTHGKTTTTAMVIWLFKELGLPVSYSVGGKLSFGGIGAFDNKSSYFIYEADEYDRNFLSFSPHMGLISGIDYDHPDIYPSRAEYYQAFDEFVNKCEKTVLWQPDAVKIGIEASKSITLLAQDTELEHIHVLGRVNRYNAHLAIVGLEKLGLCRYEEGVQIINRFPGVSRRFERIADNLYTDYAHTPEKIRGALQLVEEVAGSNVVVVYEGLHNTRQHFIKDDLRDIFAPVKELYIVPSYRAREDESLDDLTPEKLLGIMITPEKRHAATLDQSLKDAIERHIAEGSLVLCLSAGGGGSLDEWLRQEFSSESHPNSL